MAWLVIGASGQLGKSVCNVLEYRDIDYVVWNRENSDISSENYVDTYVDLMKPKAIINCAAWTDVDLAEDKEMEALKINGEAVGYLAKAAKSVDAVFAHVSTDYVFSGMKSSPWNVNDGKQPISAYGRSKAKGEELIQEIYPDNSLVFRTAWLYSPYGKNFTKTMMRLALKNNDEVRVVNDQVGQPTSAADLAEQMVLSLEKGLKPGIYHATNLGEATWNEFAKEIFRLVGENPRRVKAISSAEFKRPAPRPKYSVLSHNCWENSGVKPMRDWKEALMDSIERIKAAVISEGI